MTSAKPFQDQNSISPSLAVRLIRVSDHIHRCLDDPLTLNQMAELACLSPFHFHRCYQDVMGETLAQSVRRLRLARAALQLRQTDKPITKIAATAHYRSQAAFTRAFTDLYGQPPAAWRINPRKIQGDTAMSEVIIKAYPPLRLAGLRHVGPYPSMGRTFEKLGPLSGLQGLFGPDTKTVAVTYDDPKLVPEAALRTDCCITLAARASIAEPLQEIIIGEGLRASWRHIGPYAELGSQWMAFIKVLTAMAPDERPAPSQKPCFEIYHNDPRTTPPAELVTELFVPLD